MRRVRAAGFGIDHHFAIAVIGRDDHRAASRIQRGKRAAKTLIDRLAGADRGIEVSGMPDHVWSGIIDHDQVIARADRVNELIGHLGSGHLGLQIISCDFRAWRHKTFFALFWGLLAAVQKESDMGVFLGLGQAELTKPLGRDPSAKRIGDLTLWVGCAHTTVVIGGIVDHA